MLLNRIVYDHDDGKYYVTNGVRRTLNMTKERAEEWLIRINTTDWSAYSQRKAG